MSSPLRAQTVGHDPHESDRRARLLLVTAEPHPTTRSDVRVLFGKYLPRLGVHSDIFAMVRGRYETADWPPGKTILGFPQQSRAFNFLSTLRHDLRLFRVVGNEYDAVIVRDRVLAGAIVALACKVAGIPFVYWASFAKPESRIELARTKRSEIGRLRRLTFLVRGWLSRGLLYSFVLRNAAHIFVQSDSMREVFGSNGVDSQRLTSIPMGIDLDEFTVGSEASQHSAAPLSSFVYLGDLAAIRSPQIMVQAVAIAARSEPSVRLELVGDALEVADRNAIRRSIEALGQSSRVRVTGWLPVREALDIARGAAAGVSMVPRSPTLDLSSPTKIVEYFGLGLPVLANDSPDQARLLAAIDAETVNCNAEALAAGMVDVVRRPSHYREQARRGREFVRAHRSYDRLAARVAKVLFHVILKDPATTFDRCTGIGSGRKNEG